MLTSLILSASQKLGNLNKKRKKVGMPMVQWGRKKSRKVGHKDGKNILSQLEKENLRDRC